MMRPLDQGDLLTAVAVGAWLERPVPETNRSWLESPAEDAAVSEEAKTWKEMSSAGFPLISGQAVS